MQNTTINPLYSIVDIPAKGKGLIALKKIPKGTRILAERPLITMHCNVSDEENKQQLIKQVYNLTQHQRQFLLSMVNIDTYNNTTEQYLNIIRVNSLPAASDSSIEGGIFLDACRINHACDFNAMGNWNENIKLHTVHALRDIEEDEEITISYLGTGRSIKRIDRREDLQRLFNFYCRCGFCSLPSDQSQKLDKKLEEMERLKNLLKDGWRGPDPMSSTQLLSLIDQMVCLCDKQEPNDGYYLTLAHEAAHVIALAHGDLARGRIFAQKTLEDWKMMLGSDSPEAIKVETLLRDPTKHSSFGSSMEWRTKVDEVPQGLEPRDFEDWLWRRKDTRDVEQVEDSNV